MRKWNGTVTSTKRQVKRRQRHKGFDNKKVTNEKVEGNSDKHQKTGKKKKRQEDFDNKKSDKQQSGIEE